MKTPATILIIVCVLLGGAWWVAERLSSDAIGLALGVIFGVLSILPGAMLAGASNRRRADHRQPPAWKPPPAATVLIVERLIDAQTGALLGERCSEVQYPNLKLSSVRPNGAI